MKQNAIQVFLLFLLWLATVNQSSGQTIISKDIKLDFGAIGDGVTNDQPAFDRATSYFNTLYGGSDRWSIYATLNIPSGVYIVGGQDAFGTTSQPGGVPNTSFYLKGKNVLDLKNCWNLAIVGQDSSNTELRYANNLKYGSFDPATGQPYQPAGYFDRGDYAASIGTCIAFEQCHNVQVYNLKINGNSPNYILGGSWGDTGIQLASDAIFVNQSRRVTIQNVTARYFGRDGIQILNNFGPLGSPPSEEIALYNSKFLFNGRQGMSLTGVNGMVANNCQFNGTGHAFNIGANRELSTAPGAGIDFEPQDAIVANVVIESCQTVFNAGGGITADRPGPTLSTENNVIRHSLLWSVGVHALWVSQPGFLFENDDIYGYVLHGCDASNDAEATKFKGCRFEDKGYGAQQVTWPFLVHSDERMRRMSFDDCRFTGDRNYFSYFVSKTTNKEEYFKFNNCEFVYNHSQALPGGTYPRLIGVNLRGNNVFKDGPQRDISYRADIVIGTRGNTVDGKSQWEGVKFFGTNTYNLAMGSIQIGRDLTSVDSASVIVGNNSALVFDGYPARDTTELFIGQNAVLRIKQGSSLEILANRNVRIAGALIIEDGAYLCIDPSVQINLLGRGRVFVGPQALLTTHPTLNANNYYNHGCKTSFDFCVEGGNPGITSICNAPRIAGTPTLLSNRDRAGIPTAKLIVSPNPAESHVKIYVEGSAQKAQEGGLIEIYDNTGRKIFSQRSSNSMPVEYDLKQLPSGIYNVVYTNGRTKSTSRLLKN